MTVVYLLPSIFLSFFERTQKIMHIYYSLTPLSPKKKKWVRGERKNYFFSSILLFCNTYLEFQFLRLLTHFIIKISKLIRNMQWMVIYKHDKENKIGRGNCTACSAAILFINSDSSAPALIYFWWYKQDDFAVWYIRYSNLNTQDKDHNKRSCRITFCSEAVNLRIWCVCDVLMH